MKTNREKALEHALLRLCEECPIDHMWPPYRTAVSNALHLLTHRITAAEYLAATEAATEEPDVAKKATVRVVGPLKGA